MPRALGLLNRTPVTRDTGMSIFCLSRPWGLCSCEITTPTSSFGFSKLPRHFERTCVVAGCGENRHANAPIGSPPTLRFVTGDRTRRTISDSGELIIGQPAHFDQRPDDRRCPSGRKLPVGGKPFLKRLTKRPVIGMALDTDFSVRIRLSKLGGDRFEGFSPRFRQRGGSWFEQLIHRTLRHRLSTIAKGIQLVRHA